MNYQKLAIYAVLIFVTAISTAARAEPKANSDLGQNAALKYWQAIAMLPVLAEDERDLVSSPLESPVDRRMREVIAKAEPALKLMHKGALIESCDWGTDMSEGFGILLPHCSKVRELARLAVLRARTRLVDGDIIEAYVDLVSTLQFAHHVGDYGTTLIETLIDITIRNMVFETLAPMGPALTASQREELAAILIEIQSVDAMTKIVEREREVMPPYYEKLLRDQGAAGFVSVLTEVGIDQRLVLQFQDLLADPAYHSFVISRFEKAYQKLSEQMRQAHTNATGNDEDYGNRVKRSLQQAFAESEKFDDDTETALAKLVDKLVLETVGSYGAANAAVASSTIRHAMLIAVITHIDTGRDSAVNAIDPITKKPFEQRSVAGKPGWIELTSIIVHDGKPVSLKARIE